ncbi:MAG: PDZ domain-containing protein [Gemmataceae bacterium]|nr:PDZ domain-containing protein [Gemmata sp.]MDW8196489.1 PDZ domain-containing protein [Gemmataceae bacterium]
MRPQILLALFTTAVLAGLLPTHAHDEPRAKGDDKPIVIPFELLKSRHMALQVKINDKGPYRVIFDTGAPMNLVNNRTAKETGLVGQNDKGASLFGIGVASKTIQKFQVGAITVEGMPTMVIDHPTVEALSKVVGRLDGLIGYPFFARYKMTIDYEKKEMTLVPNGVVPGDTMQLMMKKMMGSMKGAKIEPTILAPAGLWGFWVDKPQDDTKDGVIVTEVMPESPAEAGGLKVGDRLLTLDGRWTDSVSDTVLATSFAKPGQPVTLVVQRNGREMKLQVTPRPGF